MPEFFYFELATPISKQSEFIDMDWRHQFLSSEGKKQIMEEIKILNKKSNKSNIKSSEANIKFLSNIV